MTVTKAQLDQINKWGSADLPPYSEPDLTSIRFIATNNLVGRNQGKWTAKTLSDIARLLPGLPFTCDHDWDEIEKVQGLIYAAKLVKLKAAPDGLADLGGNGAINAQIIADEGFIACVIDVAFAYTESVLAGLRLGSIGKVSIGGFCVDDYLCPICNCNMDDDECIHGIPYNARDAEDPSYAPYFCRDGTLDMGETSLVLIPNIPGAGIITREFADFFS